MLNYEVPVGTSTETPIVKSGEPPRLNLRILGVCTEKEQVRIHSQSAAGSSWLCQSSVPYLIALSHSPLPPPSFSNSLLSSNPLTQRSFDMPSLKGTKWRQITPYLIFCVLVYLQGALLFGM